MTSTTPMSQVGEERTARSEAGLGLLLLWLGPVAAFVVALLWGW
jgi:hypothetical protein